LSKETDSIITRVFSEHEAVGLDKVFHTGTPKRVGYAQQGLDDFSFVAQHGAYNAPERAY